MKAILATALTVTGILLLTNSAHAARRACSPSSVDKSARTVTCKGCEESTAMDSCKTAAEKKLADAFSGCDAYPSKNISSPPSGGSQVADVEISCTKASGSSSKSETPRPINPPVENQSGGAR